MIDPLSFLSETRRSGIDLFSGVPCSLFTSLIDTVIAQPAANYIGAANEGDALAIACGAELGGQRAAVLFQNSGLGNAVNPFTSLAETFRIPALIICSWRGQPGAAPDEPQHDRMGKITPALFELMGIPWELLPTDEAAIAATLERAKSHMDSKHTPYALIVRRGSFTKEAPRTTAPRKPPSLRLDPPAEHSIALDPDLVLRTIAQSASATDVLLTTTGFTGRALYAVGDRPNQLYMVGSMGCVSSLGLGLARAQPNRRIIVLDGDGALLIRMGALATLGYERPPNLLHILLDNGVHDSTGSQATVAPSLDTASIAAACGYPCARRVESLEDLSASVGVPTGELTFVHVPTQSRTDRKLPRPTITPAEVAQRLREWIRDHPA
jgi:phosphonopyruvate decarboxylase